MVQVSDAATEHLIRVRSERGHGEQAGARFVKTEGGVGLTFADGPRPGDRVVKHDGIAIYLEPAVAEKLDDGIIDIGNKNGRAALYLRLRQMSKSTS
jgi:Fe-S cluster assembly iron-binding protein IscA